ncbi:hypothetical protein LEP1GSC175_0351 [Leptospira santarosai str. HAI821]|uniref:hypothetical protein n=1 Tax=Leptospira santarosai TaxID=28183 RepID=UPI0002BD808C|nr:hypothetical protein [Leptospira santarosai]EMO15575.1 hypothetical protein LEP1GSC165_0997 [Leptospira santarosai str. CBC523]EMO34255.1 hypothetical protein LEP1GSC175_0351 [Leptospira santarosai str. HAI821]
MYRFIFIPEMDFYDITLFFLYENDLQNCYFRFLCSKCCFFSKKNSILFRYNNHSQAIQRTKFYKNLNSDQLQLKN